MFALPMKLGWSWLGYIAEILTHSIFLLRRLCVKLSPSGSMATFARAFTYMLFSIVLPTDQRIPRPIECFLKHHPVGADCFVLETQFTRVA